MRALDQARHVADREPFPVGVFDDADLRVQRGERIRRDFRARAGNGREQRGLARVRITDEADFRDDAKLQQKIAFVARLAWLRESRRLARGGGEIAIAQSAASAFAQNKLLPVLREVGDEFAFGGNDGKFFRVRVLLRQINFQRANAGRAAQQRTFARARAEHGIFIFLLGFIFIVVIGIFFHRFCRRRISPHERAAGNFDDQVFSRVAVHALAHARVAARRDEARDVILPDEIVEVVVGLQDHAAAASAVAAARAALGDVGLAMERDAAFAAVPRLRVNFYFVNEHDCFFQTEFTELCRIFQAQIY